jgi:hypothetical protein
MIDYLNPSHIPYANSCVSCGSEMPEGDMVCGICVSKSKGTAPQGEELGQKSALILQDYFESVRHRRELRVWLTEQIARETDQARLETLKKMKSKYE